MKTITKKNVLKLAMTVMAVFMFTAAMGQIGGDFEDVNDNTFGDAGVSYITTGKTMPFWVEPDTYYHPNFSVDGTLTGGFSWTWSILDGVGDPAGLLVNQADNYVEVEVPAGITAETDYSLSVYETAPASHGGCDNSDSPSEATIRVVPAPAMGGTNYPYFNTSLNISDGETHSVCDDMAAVDVTVQLSGYPNFQLKWTMTRAQIDENGTVVGTTETTVIDNSTGQTLGAGASLTRVVNQEYTLHNFTHVMLTDGEGNPVRTRYIYTLGGISDLISRKSDYIGATDWYADVNQVYTIIINPAPSTGPIYHIPNNSEL